MEKPDLGMVKIVFDNHEWQRYMKMKKKSFKRKAEISVKFNLLS